jgi:hypothetical protein
MPINAKELKPDIVFIGSPNLGIMEQWLPVLYELKKRDNNLKIAALFPVGRVANQVNKGDTLSELSDSIFDYVIFKSWTGAWVCSDSLFNAKDLFQSLKKPLILRATDKITKKNTYLKNIINPIVEMIARSFFESDKQVSIKELSKHVRIICFDIYEETKSYFNEVQDAFSSVRWFSLMHGISLEMTESKEIYSNSLMNKRRTDVTVYTYSEKEFKSYKMKYGIDDTYLKSVGIPRHQKEWFRHVLKNVNVDNLPQEKYIFIISRPANSNYFSDDPYKTKAAIVGEIKDLSEELKCKIVVRLHPKEGKENIYENVLGENNYGLRWEYSLLHPYLLGTHSLFCVTFFSGVAIDMIALGVPVIERLNYHKMAYSSAFTHDNYENPISLFNKLGLVMGAGDYNSLREAALKILNDRNAVIKQQRLKYEEIFQARHNAIDIISADILKALK